MVNQNGRWFGQLESFATSEGYDKKSRNYPKSSSQLKSWVNRSKPLLYQNNFEVAFEKNTSRKGFTKNSTLMTVRRTLQQEKLQ